MTEGYRCNKCERFVKRSSGIGLWYSYAPGNGDSHLCQDCKDEFVEWVANE